MKKFLSALLLCVFGFALSGCDSNGIAMTYVGTTGYSMSMGYLDVGHVVEFYKDNTVVISGSFISDGMMGSLFDVMEGEYTVEGDTYNLVYYYSDKEYEVSFDIKEGEFTTKLWLFNGYPSYDITYYNVNELNYTISTKVSYGTVQNGTNFAAYVVQLYSDMSFVLNVNENGELSTITGKYEIIVYSVSSGLSNEIKFTYELNGVESTDTFDYDANAFDFNIETSSTTNDVYVKMLKMQ